MIAVHNHFSDGHLNGHKINSVDPAKKVEISDEFIKDQATVLVELQGLRPTHKSYYEAHSKFVAELEKYKDNPLKFDAQFSKLRRKIIFGEE